MAETTNMKVGMVMTTYSTRGHRRDLALTSVRSLLQNTERENFHLVIVDDNSLDDLPKLLCREFANDDRVTLFLREQNCGVGANKREGIFRLIEKIGVPDMFYLCDDDLIYQPKWIDYALQMFVDLEKTEQVGMFGIWRHPVHPVLENFIYIRDPRYTLLRVAELPGCCVFIRPDVYHRMGMWDVGRKTDKRGDDVATTARVRGLGYALFSVTPPIVLHEGHVYPTGKEVCYHDEQIRENKEWIRIEEDR